MANLFISYSRNEITFVDSLALELEKRGHDVFLDYKSLKPGSPWQPQLDQGLLNADAILLVVSAASITSPPVYDEWTKALEVGKRIILLIFEATPLTVTDTLLFNCRQYLFRPDIATKHAQGCTDGWEELVD